MLNKKRIAILGTRGIPARYGGFETFAQEIAVRLAERGYEVTVFCERDEGEQPDSYEGVKLEYVPSPRFGPFTTIVFDLLCLLRARRGYDLVYMLGYGASLFCFIPRLWGTEVWINMDGIEWARSKWSAVARLYLRVMESVAMWTPNRIIADAEGIRQHLARRHRRLPPCAVIPYGAPLIESEPDPGLLNEWGLQPSGYYVVVCRLEPENHVLEILQGFVRSDSACPLIVVGNHHAENPYVQRLLAVRDGRIRFVGTIYDQGMLQALRYHAKAYFHGHSVGGTNPSLLEGMGCGNAVIAHDNVFNREVAGEAGVYFATAEDIPKLVDVVEKDDTRREAMRAVARQRIDTLYSWDSIADSYVDLLESTGASPQVEPGLG